MKEVIDKTKWDNHNRSYFVYAHYKKDTMELFYVGIGKRRRGHLHSQIYSRAYQCAGSTRNYLWTRCYNKHGRVVKILYDNLTELDGKRDTVKRWRVKFL